MATLREWKQAVEGLRRGSVGPFTMRNRPTGPDTHIEYLDGERVVMSMHVKGCNTGRPSNECERVFWVEGWLIAATARIYIPTDDEYEAWAEIGDESDTDHLSRMIAEREGR